MVDWRHGYRQDAGGSLLFVLALLMLAAFAIHGSAVLWLLRGAAILGFGLAVRREIRAERMHAEHPSDEEIQSLTR